MENSVLSPSLKIQSNQEDKAQELLNNSILLFSFNGKDLPKADEGLCKLQSDLDMLSKSNPVICTKIVEHLKILRAFCDKDHQAIESYTGKDNDLTLFFNIFAELMEKQKLHEKEILQKQHLLKSNLQKANGKLEVYSFDTLSKQLLGDSKEQIAEQQTEQVYQLVPLLIYCIISLDLGGLEDAHRYMQKIDEYYNRQVGSFDAKDLIRITNTFTRVLKGEYSYKIFFQELPAIYHRHLNLVYILCFIVNAQEPFCRADAFSYHMPGFEDSFANIPYKLKCFLNWDKAELEQLESGIKGLLKEQEYQEFKEFYDNYNFQEETYIFVSKFSPKAMGRFFVYVWKTCVFMKEYRFFDKRPVNLNWTPVFRFNNVCPNALSELYERDDLIKFENLNHYKRGRLKLLKAKAETSFLDIPIKIDAENTTLYFDFDKLAGESPAWLKGLNLKLDVEIRTSYIENLSKILPDIDEEKFSRTDLEIKGLLTAQEVEEFNIFYQTCDLKPISGFISRLSAKALAKFSVYIWKSCKFMQASDNTKWDAAFFIDPNLVPAETLNALFENDALMDTEQFGNYGEAGALLKQVKKAKLQIEDFDEELKGNPAEYSLCVLKSLAQEKATAHFLGIGVGIDIQAHRLCFDFNVLASYEDSWTDLCLQAKELKTQKAFKYVWNEFVINNTLSLGMTRLEEFKRLFAVDRGNMLDIYTQAGKKIGQISVVEKDEAAKSIKIQAKTLGADELRVEKELKFGQTVKLSDLFVIINARKLSINQKAAKARARGGKGYGNVLSSITLPGSRSIALNFPQKSYAFYYCFYQNMRIIQTPDSDFLIYYFRNNDFNEKILIDRLLLAEVAEQYSLKVKPGAKKAVFSIAELHAQWNALELGKYQGTEISVSDKYFPGVKISLNKSPNKVFCGDLDPDAEHPLVMVVYPDNKISFLLADINSNFRDWQIKGELEVGTIKDNRITVSRVFDPYSHLGAPYSIPSKSDYRLHLEEYLVWFSLSYVGSFGEAICPYAGGNIKFIFPRDEALFFGRCIQQRQLIRLWSRTKQGDVLSLFVRESDKTGAYIKLFLQIPVTKEMIANAAIDSEGNKRIILQSIEPKTCMRFIPKPIEGSNSVSITCNNRHYNISGLFDSHPYAKFFRAKDVIFIDYPTERKVEIFIFSTNEKLGEFYYDGDLRPKRYRDSQPISEKIKANYNITNLLPKISGFRQRIQFYANHTVAYKKVRYIFSKDHFPEEHSQYMFFPIYNKPYALILCESDNQACNILGIMRLAESPAKGESAKDQYVLSSALIDPDSLSINPMLELNYHKLICFLLDSGVDINRLKYQDLEILFILYNKYLQKRDGLQKLNIFLKIFPGFAYIPSIFKELPFEEGEKQAEETIMYFVSSLIKQIKLDKQSIDTKTNLYKNFIYIIKSIGTLHTIQTAFFLQDYADMAQAIIQAKKLSLAYFINSASRVLFSDVSNELKETFVFLKALAYLCDEKTNIKYSISSDGDYLIRFTMPMYMNFSGISIKAFDVQIKIRKNSFIRFEISPGASQYSDDLNPGIIGFRIDNRREIDIAGFYQRRFLERRKNSHHFYGFIPQRYDDIEIFSDFCEQLINKWLGRVKKTMSIAEEVNNKKVVSFSV